MGFSRLARAAGVVAITAFVLGACASADYHYSQLVGRRYHQAPIDTYPVTILSVDGRDTLQRPVLVDPGVRKITVQGPPGGADTIGKSREISLEVRPCTRYYLVAVRANRLSADFNVQVDYEEPVGGCTPPRAS